MSTLKIIKSYRGLKLYAGTKAAAGFYQEMLASLYNIFAHSLQAMRDPKALHFVLGEAGDLGNLPKYLERWRIRRLKFNENINSIKYFGAIEVRPRSKERHFHLCIVVDSISYNDIPSLKEMLQGFSLNNHCALQYRKTSFLPLAIIPETGEIPINKMGTDFRRVAKTWCHKLRLEFEDAIQRFSYICKVQTKSEPSYISSRLLKGRLCDKLINVPPETAVSDRGMPCLVDRELPEH